MADDYEISVAIIEVLVRCAKKSTWQPWKHAADRATSIGEHTAFLKAIIALAPIIGHGTGSITEEFRRITVGKKRAFPRSHGEPAQSDSCRGHSAGGRWPAAWSAGNPPPADETRRFHVNRI